MHELNIAGQPVPPPCNEGDVPVTPRKQWLWYRFRELLMMGIRIGDLWYGVKPLDTRRGPRER